MNSEHEQESELSVLLSTMLDGQMTAAQELRLGDLLRDNPEAQEVYLDCCRTHALLRQELGGRCEISTSAGDDAAADSQFSDDYPPAAVLVSADFPSSCLVLPISSLVLSAWQLCDFLFAGSRDCRSRDTDRVGVQGVHL